MIVHTHDLGTYLYGAVGAKLALFPKVIHGEHGGVLQPLGSRPKYLIAYRYLSYITQMIHTTSKDLKHELAHMTQINPKKVVAILNGVELDKFKKIYNPDIRKILAIEPDDFVIGTVSRLASVKNFELLIQVIPEINRTGLYPKVLFVGDG